MTLLEWLVTGAFAVPVLVVLVALVRMPPGESHWKPPR